MRSDTISTTNPTPAILSALPPETTVCRATELGNLSRKPHPKTYISTISRKNRIPILTISSQRYQKRGFQPQLTIIRPHPSPCYQVTLSPLPHLSLPPL